MGKEIRLRPGRVALGGIVLRSIKPAQANLGDNADPALRTDTAAAPGPQPTPVTAADIEQRRPPPGASHAQRVAYALWLDDVGATAQARQAWRALSDERPGDAVLARRAQ